MVTLRPRAGASLAEAVLALVLLAAGLLVVVGTAADAVRMLHRADAIGRATASAVSVLDSLTQHERPVPGSLVTPAGQVDWETARLRATTLIRLRIRFADGAGERTDSFMALAAPFPRRLSRVP